MYYFNILIKILPFLSVLVKAAELAFADKVKAGPEKKEAVKAGMNALFDGVRESSTGGQKETLEKLDPLFEAIVDKGIDLAATIHFGK